MRLNAQRQPMEQIVILNNHNYSAWLRDLGIRWGKKGVTKEEQKFCYLQEQISMADQVLLDRAMSTAINDQSTKKESSESGLGISAITMPYTWALSFFKEYYLGSEDITRAEIVRLKGKLSMSIADFRLNLNAYRNAFMGVVGELASIGEVVPDNELLIHFKDGCLPHEDLQAVVSTLSSTTDISTAIQTCIRHLETIKIAREKVHGKPAKGRAYKTSTQRSKCAHCNKVGHSSDACWQLYPEKRPKYRRQSGLEPRE